MKQDPNLVVLRAASRNPEMPVEYNIAKEIMPDIVPMQFEDARTYLIDQRRLRRDGSISNRGKDYLYDVMRPPEDRHEYPR